MTEYNITPLSKDEIITNLISCVSTLRNTNECLADDIREITSEIVKIKKELKKIRYGILERKRK